MSDVKNGFDSNPLLTPSTKARDWRKSRNEGYSIMLPSENIATLRPVPLDILVESGKIPDFLTPIAAKSLWSDTDSAEIASNEDLHKDFIALINIIVPLSMISPAVVEHPDPDKEEISIEDIDFMDKVAIFNLSIQPAAVLKNFRQQQAQRMADLLSGEINDDKTEHSSLSEG